MRHTLPFSQQFRSLPAGVKVAGSGKPQFAWYVPQHQNRSSVDVVHSLAE